MGVPNTMEVMMNTMKNLILVMQNLKEVRIMKKSLIVTSRVVRTGVIWKLKQREKIVRKSWMFQVGKMVVTMTMTVEKKRKKKKKKTQTPPKKKKKKKKKK